MTCAICKTAKAKRYCPGIREEICPGCCGAGREQTIDCPLNCEYLAEAHRHEKKPVHDPSLMPSQDVQLEDEFLRAHEFLIVLLGSAMYEAARAFPEALDTDAVTALDSLVAARRSLDSGIYIENKPVNPIAASMYEKVIARIEDITARLKEASETEKMPENAVLGALVFLQRVAFGLNNGRARCKAFLVFLSQFYVDMKAEEAAEAVGSEEPKIIL